MTRVGATLQTWGRVSQLQACAAMGLVTLEVGLRDDAGTESTPGRAVVALPLRNGPPLPYPFVPPG